MVKTTIVIATYPKDKWIKNIQKFLKPRDGKDYKVSVVGLDKKRTFAENNNIGAKEADTPYILFLNSDTEPKKGFLGFMERILDSNPFIGAVGAKVYFLKDFQMIVNFKGKSTPVVGKKGTIQHAGIMYTPEFLPTEYGRGAKFDVPELKRPRMMAGVTGACMLVRRGEFLNIGGFDENFKNGWEDSDLCLRYAEENKFSYYQPKAVIGHYYAGGSQFGRFDDEDANYKYWYKKWHETGRIYKIFFKIPKNTTKIDVGCGGSKKKGYFGIDKLISKDVDLIFDLEELDGKKGLPFGNNELEEIYCSHFLEHISNTVEVMNEFHRVLKKDGWLHLIVPHANSWAAFADPFHKKFFTPETFLEYFASDQQAAKETIDLQVEEIEPWHIEKLDYTVVPKGKDPFEVKREIVVKMRPVK